MRNATVLVSLCAVLVWGLGTGCSSIPGLNSILSNDPNRRDPAEAEANHAGQTNSATSSEPSWLTSLTSAAGAMDYVKYSPISALSGMNGPMVQWQQPERALTQSKSPFDSFNPFKPKTATSTNQPPPLGSNPTKNYAALTNAPEKDKVLHLYRLGLWELRCGNNEQSRKLFESALDIVDNRFGRNRSAERARGYFSEESAKTFVGEPYERVMANLYLGFLFMMDGQRDVAKACFKNAEWEDSDAEKEQYQSDFVIPYYFGGILSDPVDAGRYYQSATNSSAVYAPPPPYVPPPNTVLLIDYGRGPTKYLAGQGKNELLYYDGETTTSGVRVTTGANVVVANTYDDVTFQAITRGGRVMDHILKSKSNVKKGAKLTGWGAVLASQGLMLAGADQRVAAGVMVGGWVMHTVSEGIRTRADDRSWDNLPQCLTVASFQLPRGTHTLRVEFLDRDGNVQKSMTREVTVQVDDSRIAAAYVSEHSTRTAHNASL